MRPPLRSRNTLYQNCHHHRNNDQNSIFFIKSSPLFFPDALSDLRSPKTRKSRNDCDHQKQRSLQKQVTPRINSLSFFREIFRAFFWLQWTTNTIHLQAQRHPKRVTTRMVFLVSWVAFMGPISMIFSRLVCKLMPW